MSAVRSDPPWWYAQRRECLCTCMTSFPPVLWVVCGLYYHAGLSINQNSNPSPEFGYVLLVAWSVFAMFVTFRYLSRDAEVAGLENKLYAASLGPTALMAIWCFLPSSTGLSAILIFVYFVVVIGIGFWLHRSLAFMPPIRREADKDKRSAERSLAMANAALAVLGDPPPLEPSTTVKDAALEHKADIAEIISSGKEPALIVEQLRHLVDAK